MEHATVRAEYTHAHAVICVCLCNLVHRRASWGARVWVPAVSLRASGLLRGTHAPSCDTLVQTSFAHTDHVYAHRFIRYWTLERKRNVAILPLLGVRTPDIHSEAIAQK